MSRKPGLKRTMTGHQVIEQVSLQNRKEAEVSL